MGRKTYVHGPIDNAKTKKLQLRARGPGPAIKRKRCTNSRKEEEKDAQMCPCGRAKESRTHIVGYCETYKEVWDVLEEELRKIDECDTETFTTRHNSEKTLAVRTK